MSHFTQVRLAIKVINQDCLIAALKDIFGDVVEIHTSPVPLQGRWESGTKQAEIVVPYTAIKSYNDIGFEKIRDEFAMWIEDLDSSLLPHNGYPDLPRLKQLYTAKVIEKQARSMGAKVSSEKLPDGSIRYTLKPKTITTRR